MNTDPQATIATFDSKRIDSNELSMFKAMADNIKEKNKEALDNLNKLAQELILSS